MWDEKFLVRAVAKALMRDTPQAIKISLENSLNADGWRAWMVGGMPILVP